MFGGAVQGEAIFMSSKVEMMRTGTHTLYLLSVEESCKSRIPAGARNRLIFSPQWGKKNEASFNRHPLCHAENKGGFQFKWSIQGKVCEGEKDRQERGNVNEAVWFRSRFITHCPTAQAQLCQLLGGKRPAGFCLLAATPKRFEATWNGQFCIMLTSFLVEKISELFKSNPEEKLTLWVSWTIMFLLKRLSTSGRSLG